MRSLRTSVISILIALALFTSSFSTRAEEFVIDETQECLNKNWWVSTYLINWQLWNLYFHHSMPRNIRHFAIVYGAMVGAISGSVMNVANYFFVKPAYCGKPTSTDKQRFMKPRHTYY